jgi:hypothetical protein
MAVSFRHHEIYEQWRIADAKARAAEEDVAARLVNAIDQRVQPPGVEAWNEAKLLRTQADQLLRELKTVVHIERANKKQKDDPDLEREHPRST